jgi:hypothetical protein
MHYQRSCDDAELLDWKGPPLRHGDVHKAPSRTLNHNSSLRERFHAPTRTVWLALQMRSRRCCRSRIAAASRSTGWRIPRPKGTAAKPAGVPPGWCARARVLRRFPNAISTVSEDA